MGKASRKKKENNHPNSSSPWDNLPSGIPIPYKDGETIMKMRILKQVDGKFPEMGDEEYYTVPGGSDVPYQPENIRAGFPALLVDEEFDVLTIEQNAGQLIASMALGGLNAARHQRYVDLLKSASIVMICLPRTEAGREALEWWTSRLPNSKVWDVPPQYVNINDMKVQGANIYRWIQSGIEEWIV